MNKLPLLHMEVLGGDQMNLKMNNLPECAKMIRNVCANKGVAAAFITGVVCYCWENKINWEDMEKIAAAAHNMHRKK